MKKVILVLFTSCFFIPQLQAQKSAQELFEQSAEQMRLDNTELSLEIIETKKNGRTKVKAFDLLMARFGEVEKTKMNMQKPKRAKGITIVITTTPNETGLIEILTPANGKVRKMKATPRNLELIGSGGFDAGFFSIAPDQLQIAEKGTVTYKGKTMSKLEVREKSESNDGKHAEFLIDPSTAYIAQITSYTNNEVVSITTFSDIQKIQNTTKIYPKEVQMVDKLSGTTSLIKILNIIPKSNVKESDFVL